MRRERRIAPHESRPPQTAAAPTASATAMPGVAAHRTQRNGPEGRRKRDSVNKQDKDSCGFFDEYSAKFLCVFAGVANIRQPKANVPEIKQY